ncbi:MAG: hypothetical protein PWP15_224 [Methanothermococcus sp.]|jgi:hypothetical protein|nr:hypothetical protein [Methanothermococcus sp.]MDK2986932.1 hypothetical protein [Methanothermococcus sp.]
MGKNIHSDTHEREKDVKKLLKRQGRGIKELKKRE